MGKCRGVAPGSHAVGRRSCSGVGHSERCGRRNRAQVPRGSFAIKNYRPKSSEYPELSSSFKGSGIQTIVLFLAGKARSMVDGSKYSKVRA
eukprot:10606047-Alexandrium_andersonii.AAC.1